MLTESCLYGFPLVFNLEQVIRMTTTGIGSTPPAAFNSFSHGRALAGPADTFVSINNDTVYSMATVDLSVGPVALHVPETGGRYYVLQFVDAWTNNFAYVGHRATGTGEGDFLLVAPGWEGEAADGVTVIRFPTTIAAIVGRWAVGSADELPAVHALQDATTLTQMDAEAIPAGLDAPDPTVPEALGFLEKLRVWSQQFPPAPRDRALQESLAPLGIGESGSSPFVDLPEETVASLAAGLATGRSTLENVLKSGLSTQVNGWTLGYHVFDYNLDYFEVGTVDDDEFKISDPKARIAARAGAALGGLWGNHAYEAAYVMTYVDDRGEQLTGEHTYTLRFDPLPPVNAFWSVTMYSLPDFFLVDNPIDRYSIGDRTPGIVLADDGSLTVTISHERPRSDVEAANWLPAPAGEFRPVLRMYEPGNAVLDGTYTVPPIIRAPQT
nr:DUF1254 domain-containing protein [Microbacterium ureisolvens]